MTVRTMLAICAASLAFAPPVLSYELTTHAAMTYNAYKTSKLSTDSAVPRDLGIDWFLADPGADSAEWDQNFKSTNPFGEKYIDTSFMSGSDSSRAVKDFEREIIDGRLTVPAQSLPGWLMRGAVREDDSGSGLTGAKGEPFDDPYGDFNRWCNHFFDPTKSDNRAATFFCFFDVYQDAVNWALGTNDAFSSPTTAFPLRRNHFSVLDAREALYRAVTGKKKDGTAIGTGDADADFKTRKTYYATTFRALGDVMHLNQDMAQPQHTRNESHAGAFGTTSLGGNPAYERHIDARAKGEGQIGSDGQPILPGPLPYAGYAPPRFTRLSDYWSTAPGLAVPSGKGLADYSSREFFTPENNYGSSRYASPVSVPEKYTPSITTISVPNVAYPLTVTYLRGTVTDSQAGSGASILMTKEGVWKDMVSGTSSASTYTQDNVIFDDMATQLVPRAVGYSAGILDYFFRGKMQISAPDGGAYAVLDHSKITINPEEVLTNFKGFGKIKIKLAAPDTGNDGQPQSFGGGKLLGVLKFRRNTCFDNDLTKFVDLDQGDADGTPKFQSCRSQAEEVIVSDPVNGGAPFTPTNTPQPLTLNFSKQLPLNATDVRLQMVFRGKLGVEDDEVVVATQDLSEPTYFSYINASDYWTIDMGAAGVQVFTRDQINASQTLLQKLYPQGCVDKTVSPWQLRSSCLQPFDIQIGLRVGAFKIDVPALPVRRLMRIAFLGDAGTAVNLDQIPQDTCYPHDSFAVDGLGWQSNPDADNNPTAVYPQFQKIRGVWGWYGTSCVGNGDGLNPGGADNRNEAMTDLSDTNKAPVEVTIDDGDPPQ
jgi:hypothetical protein